jgi:hypothetical protein
MFVRNYMTPNPITAGPNVILQNKTKLWFDRPVMGRSRIP